jgi:hypothetical protein
LHDKTFEEWIGRLRLPIPRRKIERNGPRIFEPTEQMGNKNEPAQQPVNLTHCGLLFLLQWWPEPIALCKTGYFNVSSKLFRKTEQHTHKHSDEQSNPCSMFHSPSSEGGSV